MLVKKIRSSKKIKLTLLLAMIVIASFLIIYAITFYYGVQRVKLQTKLIQNELLPGLIQINHAENKTKIIIDNYLEAFQDKDSDLLEGAAEDFVDIFKVLTNMSLLKENNGSC